MAALRRGHHPASYPSPPTPYQAGALDLRRFLVQTKKALYRHRQFKPAALREMLDYQVGLESLNYRAGFLDALCVYLLLALEGCLLDPGSWDVLADIDRR